MKTPKSEKAQAAASKATSTEMVLPGTVPVNAVLPTDNPQPAACDLPPEIKTPHVPKRENVDVALPTPATPVARVSLSHRDALIARKRAQGLKKDQAIAAADAQIARDQVLQSKARVGSATGTTLDAPMKDRILRHVLGLPQTASDEQVLKAYHRNS